MNRPLTPLPVERTDIETFRALRRALDNSRPEFAAEAARRLAEWHETQAAVMRALAEREDEMNAADCVRSETDEHAPADRNAGPGRNSYVPYPWKDHPRTLGIYGNRSA